MDTVLAIYPSARKVEDVLMQQAHQRIRLDYRVFTFPQLLDRLAREFIGRRPVLDPLAERLLVQKALSHASAEAHADLPQSAGLISHLVRLIREFKAAGLRPEDLREAADVLSQDTPSRTRTLAEVFASYETELGGLVDSHARESKVLDRLLAAERAGSQPRALEGTSQLLVAEIYDFSLLEFLIVSSLIRIVRDARLSLLAEPVHVDAARFPELTWNRFVEDESIADFTLPEFVRRDGRPGRLGFVLGHLMVSAEDTPEPPPVDDTLALIEARDPRNEIEEVAREIRRALEARPLPLRRVAIIARDLAPYADHIEDVFSRFRIPIQIPGARQSSDTPAARLGMAILRLPLEHYRREAIEGVLASPQLAILKPSFRSLLAECGYLDSTTHPLDRCLEDRLDVLRRELDASPPDRKPGAQRRLDRVARAAPAFQQFLALLARLESRASVAVHARRAAQTLGQMRFGMPAEGRESAADAAWAMSAAQLARVLASLAAAADQTSFDAELGLEEFLQLLEAALAETPANAAERRDLDAVRALSVIDARGLDFDLVFVIGLADGVFPSYHGDDPLLPDALRLKLNPHLARALRARFSMLPGKLGKILRTRYERNAEDRFLFFLALSMATRRLVMTYPAADEKGGPLIVSPFVAETLRLLREEPDGGFVRKPKGQGAIPDAADCFELREFIGHLVTCAAPESARLEASFVKPERLESIARRIEVERRRECYLELPTRHETGEHLADAKKFGLADEHSGRVGPLADLARLLEGTPDKPAPWTAGRLSEIGACGFKFMASRVLRLSEDDEPDYEASPLERGSLAHEIMHRLFVQPLDLTDYDRALERARALLKSWRDEMRSEARDPTLFEIEWRRIGQIVEEVIALEVSEHEAGRAFSEPPLVEHEFSFQLDDWGDAAARRPRQIVLAGRIDRLEANTSGGAITRLRVIDYKTSRNLKQYQDAINKEFGRTEFQLPVYLMAALNEYRDQLSSNVSLEAAFLVLRSREKLYGDQIERHRVETDPKLRAADAAAGHPSLAERIFELVGEAREGRFDVDPLKCEQFCPYRRVCRLWNVPESP